MTGPHIVVVGGGTGNYNVLAGLKKHSVQLTAIVAMSDSGGSSGRLRDELGQLPPGDVRQCLVALAGDEEQALILRQLFTYRFSAGQGLEGHSFGNLLLAVLTEITGGPERAIEAAARLLNVRGQVLPVTLTRCHLHAVLTDGAVLEGEAAIDTYGGAPGVSIDYVYLTPRAYPYPPALRALEEADLIVFSPGDLYTSLVANLLVEGVADAILHSPAKVVQVMNLMTKPGETDGFRASTFVEEMGRYLGKAGRIDYLLLNSEELPARQVKRYERDRAYPVEVDRDRCAALVSTLVECPLLAEGQFVRHDPGKLAQALVDLAHAEAPRRALGAAPGS
ncbi:MAG: YvcK family protein [Chloroflexi bacterium]|nr:YvcK family protein [Chloroflexota bacterium]